MPTRLKFKSHEFFANRTVGDIELKTSSLQALELEFKRVEMFEDSMKLIEKNSIKLIASHVNHFFMKKTRVKFLSFWKERFSHVALLFG